MFAGYGTGSQSDLASDWCFVANESSFGLLMKTDDLFGVVIETLASFGEEKASTFTMKKSDANATFQRVNTLADGGLGDAKRSSGRCEAA